MAQKFRTKQASHSRRLCSGATMWYSTDETNRQVGSHEREGRYSMARIKMADVLGMSVAERILFVQDVWDSVAATPEAVPLTDAQREELDRRLDAYHKDPDAGSPWPEVRARISGRAYAANQP